MNAPNLITPADIKTIQRAIECCYEESISHTADSYKITLSVVPTEDYSRPIWNQTHLIQVEQFAGQVYSRKFCKDIRELRWYLGL